jgi:capsular polysaccharide biosynthesis protein
MTAPLAEYGRLLVERWRWIVWGILLALAITTAVLLVEPPLYRSDATVFVRTPGDVSRVEDGGDSYARARAGTYAALIKSTSISARVISNLGLDMKPETLSNRIDASHTEGTALIQIGVSAPSPEEAQRTATVLLSEFAATVRSLESVPGALIPRAEIVVVDPPGEPARILAWGAPLYLVVLGAILVGMVLGALGAVIRSILAPPVQPAEAAPAEPVEDESTTDDAVTIVDEVPKDVAAEPIEPAEDVDAVAAEEVEDAADAADVEKAAEAEKVGEVEEAEEVDPENGDRGGWRRHRQQALSDANGPPR